MQESEIRGLIDKLWPLNRSITGEGVRETLGVLGKVVPLDIVEVPSGSKVFDWTVPLEWTLKEAYIEDSSGNRICSTGDSVLHLMAYSVPFRGVLPLTELKEHLHSIPEHSEWIPYRTSYYADEWGFCLSQDQLDGLEEGQYGILIDTSFKDGSLSYGELFLPGEVGHEVVISTYTCHPSMGNDNLSGVVLTAALASWLADRERYYSYRFLFVPETIGAITWLARNENIADRIICGMVVTCVGDRGSMTYKRSKLGSSVIDRAVEKVLTDSGEPHEVVDFFPMGSDERQYSSPGFDLPFGSLMRTPYGRFPEYHTSADDRDFLSVPHLMDSIEKYQRTIEILEGNRICTNTNQKCEPQLGKYGLYRKVGGERGRELETAMLWVLNCSDGSTPLLDIAIRSGIEFGIISESTSKLCEAGLLRQEE